MHVDEASETDAYDFFQKYKDQDFSIVDCTSFALMRQNQIRRCFTFDRHFDTMGFERIPV